MGTTMDEIKRIDRKLVHKGHILDFYCDTIQLPNGSTTEFDFLMHKGAAAVVPVMEDGRIVMVRQFRNAVDRQTLEIPAGGINPGESPIDSASRELTEETGFRAGKIEPLLDLNTTFALTNEMIYIYAAFDLQAADRHLDPDEFIDVEYFELKNIIDMILSRQITDAKTIASILAYKEKYKVK